MITPDESDFDGLKPLEPQEPEPAPKFPFRTMAELSDVYAEHVRHSDAISLSLARWLPGLAPAVRPLIPGELCFIMADTGHGKSMALQNIAMNTEETCLFFELELPDVLLFERFMATAHSRTCLEVEQEYRAGRSLHWGPCGHILVCDETRLNLQALSLRIAMARSKHPEAVIVLVDYIGLMSGSGKSRYERMSSCAEDLKVLAKETKSIVVAATQRSRPSDSESAEVDLHDAKDSGAIENSADLFLGMWRDPDDASGETLWVRVLKNRKGRSQTTVHCHIDGARMTIRELATERRPDDADYPFPDEDAQA